MREMRGLIPRDWKRVRVRFPAQLNDGCRAVWHRPAGGARLLYFSAVHVETISSDHD